MMSDKPNNLIEARYDEAYGVVLTVQSDNEADEMDDFLTEEYYVFYDQRPKKYGMEFFFGQASSVDVVQEIVECFVLRRQESSGE